MWTLNWANNPIQSNTEDTSGGIFPWVIDSSTSLFVPLHTWSLLSFWVNCSPNTEDLSVLGSTSTCFVLLIDFKSSGITTETASLLLIHNFSSNRYCERSGCSWLKASIASSGVSTDLTKSSTEKLFLMPLLRFKLVCCLIPVAWKHNLRKLENS